MMTDSHGETSKTRVGLATLLTLSFLSLLLPGLVGCGSAASSDGKKVRVVLVTLDTLRWEAVLGDEPLMPRLRALADGATLFSSAYTAASSTQPTHASLFTGMHPWQHGVPRNGAILADDFTVLAELLSDEGYNTAAVVASFPLHSSFGFAQGFDEYDDDFEGGGQRDKWSGAENHDDAFWSPASIITARAIDQLDALSGDKQFLWVHYFDAHAPYGNMGENSLALHQLIDAARRRDPALAGLLVKARAAYKEDVAMMDASLDELIQRLAQDADEWTTHLVITADHGESFGEDGSFGHGKRLTPSQVNVPLVVDSPDMPPGLRDDAAASVDVTRLLLDLAGVRPPKHLTMRRDLRKLPTSDPAPIFGMRRTFEEPFDDVRADGTQLVVDEPRFYAVINGKQVIGNADELVSGSETLDPQRADHVRALFGAFTAELAASEGAMSEQMDEATLAALEALGYVR